MVLARLEAGGRNLPHTRKRSARTTTIPAAPRVFDATFVQLKLVVVATGAVAGTSTAPSAGANYIRNRTENIVQDIKLADLDVGRIGLGTMGMSAYHVGAGVDDDESIRTIHRALELGVTLIDTADVCGPYINEQLVGRALIDPEQPTTNIRGRHERRHAGRDPYR